MAVERAENKLLQTVRIEAQADECCPVELLSAVLALDRALHPDCYAGERRVDAALGEDRHISRRQQRGHPQGTIPAGSVTIARLAAAVAIFTVR